MKPLQIISGALKEIGVDGARWIEENMDDQFKALQHLWKRMPSPKDFVKTVTANALVSYQLSGKGEEWWWDFARRLRGYGLEYHLQVLRESPFNRRLLPAKIRRLERFYRWAENVDLLPYYTGMDKLWKDIASAVSSPPPSKTVCFAVKMFGYAARIATERFNPYPFEVPIPVDSRIEGFSRFLGANKPLEFWQEMSRRSNVPPLHIDSILWPFLGGKKGLERFGRPGLLLSRLTSSYLGRR